MNCKVNKLNICRLIQESFKSPTFEFGSVDISNDSFVYKVGKYGQKMTEYSTSIYGNVMKINELTLQVGEYNHEMIWYRNNESFLLFQGLLEVKKEGSGCGCGVTSTDNNIFVVVDENIVKVNYSEQYFNRGERGEKGDKGDTGERGEQGIQGERGERGEKGEKGDAGAVTNVDNQTIFLNAQNEITNNVRKETSESVLEINNSVTSSKISIDESYSYNPAPDFNFSFSHKKDMSVDGVKVSYNFFNSGDVFSDSKTLDLQLLRDKASLKFSTSFEDIFHFEKEIGLDGIATVFGENILTGEFGAVTENNNGVVTGGEVYKYLNLELKNISINGNFTNGLSNWTIGSSFTDVTINNDEMFFTGKGGVTSVSTRISQTSLPLTSDIVFICMLARSENGGYLQIGRGTTTGGAQFNLTSEFQNYYTTNNNASNILKFSAGINARVHVKNIMAFNLTAIFGTGKEPTAEVFSSLLNADGNFISSKFVDIRNLAFESTEKANSGYGSGEQVKTLKQVEYLTNLTLNNLNNNGDFNSTLNWTVGGNITNSSISLGSYKFTGAGEPLTNETQVYRILASIPNTSKILVSVVAKSDNGATLMFGRGLTRPLQNEKLTSNYKRYSGVFDTASTRVKIGANLGGNVEIDSISIIDLTAIFGAGNEPDAEFLTQILNLTGYFETTVTVENNRLKIATEKEIKELKNSVRKQLKVLLIGSSHGIDTILHFPVLAHYGGVDIVCGNLYSGGNDIVDVADKIRNNTDFATYGLHFGTGAWLLQNTGVTGGRTVKKALENYNWDIIILQRGAFQSSTWTQEQKEAMFFVTDYIRKNTFNNPEIMFNSGFSLPIDVASGYTKQNQLDRTNEINLTAQQAKEDLFFETIPVCTAIQNARDTLLKNYGTWIDKDVARDNIHLDTGIGAYITGCTMFEKILNKRFNISIRNMNYIPTRANVSGLISTVSSFTEITEDMSKVAKLCALSAVMNPFELSETLPINFP